MTGTLAYNTLELMRSGSGASTEEFEAAALPHLNDIYRTAVGMLRNPTEAEDLAQDVYLHAWKSFHRFQAGTNCRAWLFKILFHRLHHHRRKWFRMPLGLDDTVLEATLAAEPPVPDGITDEEVLAAIARVPEDFREVLLLADVEEFAYKEIAETLGIPIGTVMSRLSRGRKLLRADLADMAAAMGIGKAREQGSTV